MLSVKITGIEATRATELVELAKLKWIEMLRNTPAKEALELISVVQITEESRGMTRDEFFAQFDDRPDDDTLEATADLQTPEDY